MPDFEATEPTGPVRYWVDSSSEYESVREAKQ